MAEPCDHELYVYSDDQKELNILVSYLNERKDEELIENLQCGNHYIIFRGFEEGYENEAVFDYQTRYSPDKESIQKLSKTFPKLVFVDTYDSFHDKSIGCFVYQNENVLYEEHKEYADKFKNEDDEFNLWWEFAQTEKAEELIEKARDIVVRPLFKDLDV